MSAGTAGPGGPAPEGAAPASTPSSLPPVRRQRSYLGIVAVVIVVIVVAGVLAVGYEQKWFGGGSSGTTEASCVKGITLQGNGAQIVNPLLSVWTADYGSAYGNQVNYVDGGSGTGLTDFSENPPLIDFAITDNPLSAAQRDAMPSQPLTLPFVGGAITVIYNLPGVSGNLNLNGTVLGDIFQGTITNWDSSQIAAENPGVTLPNQNITTVHRTDSAGTSYVFTTFLGTYSSYWADNKGLLPDWPKGPNALGVKGNSLILSTVSSTKYSISYSDLTDTLTYTPALQYAAVENPAGHYIVPTLANTASAITDKIASTEAAGGFPSSTGSWYNISMVNANGTGDYPIATFIYLYVYQAGNAGYEPSLNKTQVIIQWVTYILSPAAQALTDATSPTQLYYVALPSSILSIDQAGLSTMTFNGAAIPACK